MTAIEESGDYRVTRSKGWGPGRKIRKVIFRHLDEAPARRFYKRTPPAPGYIIALWRPDRLHQRPRTAGKLMPHRRGHLRNSTIWDHRSYERAPKHAAGLIGLGVVGSNPLQNVKGSEQQMARTHPAAFQQPAWCR